eukprot:Platyproteum_vivax@DN1348_c0_g1_i1.p1
MLPFDAHRAVARQLSSSRRATEYIRRMFQCGLMDLEYTYTQMVYLCISPKKVYQFVAYRKQTKNQWARDDPGFLVLLAGFLTVTGFAYSAAFGLTYFSFFLVCFLPVLSFLICGVFISTICWFIATQYLRADSYQRLSPNHYEHSSEYPVEWLYAFDIHCNGFFPYFLLCYVLQYFFLPVLLSNSTIACLCSNILYAVAIGNYFYITSLGFALLPFLESTQVFLYPAVLTVFMAIINSIIGLNPTRVFVWTVIGPFVR